MNKDSIKLGLKTLKVKCFERYVGTLAMTPDGKVAFSYDDEWLVNGFAISPAYDITYSNTYYGEHTTSVDGNGKNPGEKELMNVGTGAGIKKSLCADIIDEIRTIVGEELAFIKNDN